MRLINDIERVCEKIKIWECHINLIASLKTEGVTFIPKYYNLEFCSEYNDEGGTYDRIYSFSIYDENNIELNRDEELSEDILRDIVLDCLYGIEPCSKIEIKKPYTDITEAMTIREFLELDDYIIVK